MCFLPPNTFLQLLTVCDAWDFSTATCWFSDFSFLLFKFFSWQRKWSTLLHCIISRPLDWISIGIAWPKPTGPSLFGRGTTRIFWTEEHTTLINSIALFTHELIEFTCSPLSHPLLPRVALILTFSLPGRATQTYFLFSKHPGIYISCSWRFYSHTSLQVQLFHSSSRPKSDYSEHIPPQWRCPAALQQGSHFLFIPCPSLMSASLQNVLSAASGLVTVSFLPVLRSFISLWRPLYPSSHRGIVHLSLGLIGFIIDSYSASQYNCIFKVITIPQPLHLQFDYQDSKFLQLIIFGWVVFL